MMEIKRLHKCSLALPGLMFSNMEKCEAYDSICPACKKAMGIKDIRVGLIRPRQWVKRESGGGSQRNLISLASLSLFFSPFLFGCHGNLCLRRKHGLYLPRAHVYTLQPLDLAVVGQKDMWLDRKKGIHTDNSQKK